MSSMLSPRAAIVELENLSQWVRRWRRDNPAGRVVATNGCFDVIHIGHTRCLEASRALGDCLVVGVNSDESVRNLKGSGRPVNSQEDRAEILASLRSVSAVSIFPHRDATELLRLVQPDVYTKGGDYSLESMNPEERELLTSMGTRIEFIKAVPDRSTTRFLESVPRNVSPRNK